MDLSASTVKMIPKRTVAGVTATSAASSKILTNSCCAMNATWPFTPTVWILHSPPSLRMRTGRSIQKSSIHLKLNRATKSSNGRMEDLKNDHQCVRLGFNFYFTFHRYCPGCRNDVSEVVLAGEKLKESKKKAKMASASSSSQRDWGKVSANTIWILNLSAFFFFSSLWKWQLHIINDLPYLLF